MIKHLLNLFFVSCIALPIVNRPLAADTMATGTSNNLPSIKINGRQLLVDGKPFIIKAVCYNPVRKGESYTNNDGTNPKSLMTAEPSQDDLVMVEADFQAMKEAGINTIRTYYPITNHKILELLDTYDLKVIVPVFTTYKSHTKKNLKIVEQLKNEKSTLFWEVGNEWNYNLFYATNTASAALISTTPASSTDPSTDLKHKQIIDLAWCISYVSSRIDLVKEHDPTHPVSTCIGDISPDINGFWKKLPYDKIDIFGVNIYDGASFNNQYSPRFDRWKAITQPSHPGIANSDGVLDTGGIGPKPLYISEFGATAYNLGLNGVPLFSLLSDVDTLVNAIDQYFLPSASQYILPISPIPLHDKPGNVTSTGIVTTWGVDENAQADGITALVTEIQNNLSATNPENPLLGGALFEFHDEWWKTPNSDPSTHSIRGFGFTDPKTGILCGGPYPDGYYHEEWFGLLTIDREKRPAYYALKALYTQQDH